MSPHDVVPDGPMSPEEAAVAASLSSGDVAKIDAAILSHATAHRRKVAMIVSLAMSDAPVAGLPDLFYAERVKHLVKSGKLVAFGNVDYMRYSEVRLAEGS